MRILVLCCLLLGVSATLKAQFVLLQKPSEAVIQSAPEWAQLMYSDQPIVAEVDAAYKEFFRQRAFEKSYHTQYYKRWRRQAGVAMGEGGRVDTARLAEFFRGFPGGRAPEPSPATQRGGSLWSVMGPTQTYNWEGQKRNDQTNVYSLTQCAADLSVLYAGTEPGEIYKSIDGGMSWFSVTRNYFFNGVEAICVDPTDADVVYASNGWNLMKSADGGETWDAVLTQTSLWVKEILVLPSNPDVVLLAANTGLYRSADAGNNWTQISSNKAWDIKAKPGSDSTVFALQSNAVLRRSEFWISQDQGATWTLSDNGWYSSTDPARSDIGSRLAVTPADPNRVYAYLIGEAKAGDLGFIGVYRSDDGGESWTLPNGPPGGPYSPSHPNLAIGWPGWDYHQGFYNCAIAASPDNPDKILIGGLNCWKSDDGGASFSPVAGYIGGYLPMHVDMQDFRVTPAGTWITNDGGITFSSDFYASDFEIRMEGLHGSDYWGFGVGWNEDVHVGGLYHNGNLAWHENYGDGSHLQLGGAEPPSGYVNPGKNRQVYSSELGTVTMPEFLGQPIFYAALGISPNESYFTASSSEMEFDPSCYNTLWLGREQKLWRSEDGGTSFNLIYTFPGSTNAQVRYFEIARSNPQVIYLSQAPATGAGTGRLWKSPNGGVDFGELALPGSGGGRDRILLQVDPEDELRVYLAFPGAAPSAKVFRSDDGGFNWTNISGSVFATHEIRSILLSGASGGGLYASTDKGVFFRSDAMSDWEEYSAGLPAYANSNILKPFYRDGELRLATYGKGVWKAPLRLSPQYPIAKAMVDKMKAVCSIDTFFFEDYSILEHDGASWQWTFEGGSPETSTLRNPAVVFSGEGGHWATLEVSDPNGLSSRDSILIQISGVEPSDIAQDFEGVFPPEFWTTQGLNSGAGIWNRSNRAGGFGSSENSATADNFNIDLQGGYGDLRAYVNIQPNATELSFDVAYTPYGGQYSDTLEVLLSSDCGQSFVLLYRKGGMDLSTAPPFQADVFVPLSEEWRTETLDMSAWAGTEDAMLVFRNRGHWGQMLYLDNVNLDGFPVGMQDPLDGQEQAAQRAEIYPNPLPRGGSLQLIAAQDEPFTLHLYNLKGVSAGVYSMRSGERLVLPIQQGGAYAYRLESPSFFKTGILVLE